MAYEIRNRLEDIGQFIDSDEMNWKKENGKKKTDVLFLQYGKIKKQYKEKK